MLVKGKENKRKSLESGKNNNEIIRQGLGMVTHKGNVTDEKGQRKICIIKKMEKKFKNDTEK